jgi:hypothetical protein
MSSGRTREPCCGADVLRVTRLLQRSAGTGSAPARLEGQARGEKHVLPVHVVQCKGQVPACCVAGPPLQRPGRTLWSVPFGNLHVSHEHETELASERPPVQGRPTRGVPPER